jgi:PAS domain S-box-containing protein
LANQNGPERTRRKSRPYVGWTIFICILLLGGLNWYAWRGFDDSSQAYSQDTKEDIEVEIQKAKSILVRETAPGRVRLALPPRITQVYILDKTSRNLDVIKGSADAREGYAGHPDCIAARKRAVTEPFVRTKRLKSRDGELVQVAYVPLPSADGGQNRVAEMVIPFRPLKPISELKKRLVYSAVASVLLTGVLVTLAAYSVSRPVRELGRSLSEAETYNQYILNSISGGVITVDMEGVVKTFNATAERMLGLPAGEAMGRKLEQALPQQKPLFNVMTRTLRGQARYSRYELEVTAVGGRPLALAVSSTLIKDEDGNTIGATLYFDDLTETKRLRKEVALKERLAALGELSAGMAHEIRNPLGGIQLMAGLLKRKLPDRQDLSSLVQDIITEVRVLERIVAEFLDFARPPRIDRKPARITEVAEQALALCGRLMEEARANIQRNYRVPDTKSFAFDAEQVKRVMLNLLRNAAQAMEPGGVLTLTIGEQEYVGAEASDGPGTQLVVEVSNTGSYIPPEHIDKIFNPFFSTKETGTGIGLAIVHKIVENHGGTIGVESNTESGTVFRFTLPAAEAKA